MTATGLHQLTGVTLAYHHCHQHSEGFFFLFWGRGFWEEEGRGQEEAGLKILRSSFGARIKYFACHDTLSSSVLLESAQKQAFAHATLLI